MVHEIYRSPPNTGSDRVSELSIMWLCGGGSDGVSAGVRGEGARGAGQPNRDLYTFDTSTSEVSVRLSRDTSSWWAREGNGERGTLVSESEG